MPACAPAPAHSAQASSVPPCAAEPHLADWSMSAADRKRLEGPLSLSAYQPDFAYNRGVSHVDRPSAAKGLHLLDQRDPRLASFLELMCHNRDMRERLFKSTWYESELVKIREDFMFIRELAFCPLEIVSAVLLYFPKMRVCARSAHFDHPGFVGHLHTRLAQLLQLCDPQRLTLVHVRADGQQLQAPCPACLPTDLASGIQWQPMRPAPVV